MTAPTLTYDVPVVVGASGRINTPPSTLLSSLLALVSSTNPGYTANLPGSLIEDISSTDVAALVICDQYLTELINSLTPLGANAFLLYQLGQQFGIPVGQTTNTSVYVTFTGTPGFFVPPGLVVSDGVYQYLVQDGGFVQSGNSTVPLYCVATQSGTWSVPTHTVTTVSSSVPSLYTLTCTNASAGVPSLGGQTEEQYRAQVLLANQAPASAFGTQLRTNLLAIPGVQPQLVSIQQQSPGWKVIVGGGDPYAVAGAIFNSGIDVSALVGSLMTISNITNATAAVITTALNHGLTTGNSTTINAAAGMSGINGTYTVTVLTETTFSVPVNTTSSGSYTPNSGYLTPNNRNITATVINYPDTYSVEFINPPQQVVTVSLTWNTNSVYSVSATAVAQLGAPAIQAYVNSVPVGQSINLFELQATFQNAVASLFNGNAALITRMLFAVYINGFLTAPTSGTGLISGDPESYFYCSSSGVTITQG